VANAASCGHGEKNKSAKKRPITKELPGGDASWQSAAKVDTDCVIGRCLERSRLFDLTSVRLSNVVFCDNLCAIPSTNRRLQLHAVKYVLLDELAQDISQ